MDSERYASLEHCSYYTPDTLNEILESPHYRNLLGLSVLHINARSLTRNIDAILDLLNSLHRKIVCILISESWLTEIKSAPNIPGYTFIGNNRASKTGGGTGLYILDNIAYKTRADLHESSNKIESTFIELLSPGGNIIIGCAYKPPNINYNDFFEALE